MSRERDETGAVAVLVAMVAVILFVLAGLVVDLGLGRDVRRQSQNAADASALAGANALYPVSGACLAANPDTTTTPPCFGDAINAAKDLAANNYGVTAADWSSCTDSSHFWYPSGGTPCISFTDATLLATQPLKPSKVRVLTPMRSVKTGFGTLAGISTIPIDSVARATLDTSLTQPCALCLLGSGTHNFQNGDANVTGGDIYMNGSSDVSNNGLVASDGNIYVQGTASGGLNNYTPDPTTGVPPITDPLAGVLLPSAANSWYGATAKTNPCTNGPGIYAGWAISNSTCALQPGLYVVASGIVNLSGNASTNLTGAGVTIYLTCGSANVPHDCAAAGEKGASFDASGGGNVAITAPTTGNLKGVAIAADRHNIDPANNQPLIRLTGNGTLGMSGAIYAASATLQMNGNGCSNGLNAMVVTSDIVFNGNNSCLTLNYNASQNPDATPGKLRLDQ